MTGAYPVNRRTIIIGEVATGKTLLTSKILQRLLQYTSNDVALIDMAPQARGHIGGKIVLQSDSPVRYYTDDFSPPRLTSSIEDEIFKIAHENRLKAEKIFTKYIRQPALVLFINDVSIYLQAGDIEVLWSVISSTPTVVTNGYLSKSLGGGKFGDRERYLMKILIQKFDLSVFLS